MIGSTHGATFPVTAQDTEVNALVDSGAGKSCMSYDMYLTLDLPPIQERVLNVVGAQGGSLEPMGIVQCPFSISKKQFQSEFIVCRALRRPMVLGLDFWRKYAIGFMCTPRRTRKLFSNEELLLEVDDHDQVGIPIELKRALRIPARTFMVASLSLIHI